MSTKVILLFLYTVTKFLFDLATSSHNETFVLFTFNELVHIVVPLCKLFKLALDLLEILCLLFEILEVKCLVKVVDVTALFKNLSFFLNIVKVGSNSFQNLFTDILTL